jgi:acetyltransferase-like isoleucine patch superfamily enzyme
MNLKDYNMNNIFDKLRNGVPVNMMDDEYMPVIEYMQQTNLLNFRINNTVPTMNNLRPLEKKFFEGNIDETSFITPPFHIDFPNQMKIGKRVFVNHSLTCMSIGGITIGEGTMIGPHVIIATDNHDLRNKMILVCKSVEIGDNVWIGAGAKILPGVHIGDNAVVGSGAVVTKDVEANTVVAGVPAKFIKNI